jgi:hypothetical protein
MSVPVLGRTYVLCHIHKAELNGVESRVTRILPNGEVEVVFIDPATGNKRRARVRSAQLQSRCHAAVPCSSGFAALPPEIQERILDASFTRADVTRMRANEHGRGFLSWVREFTPFLVSTEGERAIRSLVGAIWDWHRAEGRNPWCRTRQNTYEDLGREYDFTEVEPDETAFTNPGVSYTRAVRRTGTTSRWFESDRTMDTASGHDVQYFAQGGF